MNCCFETTTNGRAAIAACMALKRPPDICRVSFGSGKIAEDADLTDQHTLLAYVADGTVAGLRHQNDRLYFTIQYANSEHPDVETFYLSEFVVYIKDPVTGAETDFLYGTMGDYPLPVPQYHENLAPSVFNLPLTTVLSSKLTVRVTAPSGFVTLAELREAVESAVASHNADPDAHPALQNATAALDSRLTLLELMYNTEVSGNPFSATFESLTGLSVTGVWDKTRSRIEF